MAHERCACPTSILRFYMEVERAKEATDRLKDVRDMKGFWVEPLKAVYEQVEKTCFGAPWEKVGDRLSEVEAILDDPRRAESERLFFAKSKLSQAQTGLLEALGDWCKQ